MRRDLPAAPPGLLAGLLLLSLMDCAFEPLEPAVKILVSPLPAQAVSLQVESALNEQPTARALQFDLAPVTGQPQASFGLYLPRGTRGQLLLWVRARSAAGCVLAQGLGQVAVSDLLEVHVRVPLEPVTGPPCAMKTPQIVAISPGTLPTSATDPVVISGAGFFPGTKVQIGGKDLAVTRISQTELRTRLPDLRGTRGKVAVRVIGPDGAEDTRDDLLTLRPGTVSFRQAAYTVDEPPRAVAAADIDGDGDLDLLTTGEDKLLLVSMLRNNGDGTLARPTTYGDQRNGVYLVAHEARTPGRPDLFLVTAGAGAFRVLVLRNPGDGAFSAVGREEKDVTIMIQRLGHLAVGDLRKSGKADIVVANPGQGAFLSVLQVQEDGTYGELVSDTNYRFPTDFPPYLVALADLDQDGYPDAVFRDAVQVGMALNDRMGRFPQNLQRSLRLNIANGLGSCMATGDLNGDGFPDLAAQDPNGNAVKVYYNKKKDPKTGQWLGLGDPQAYPVGNLPYCPVLADLNADGVLDMAVLNALDTTVTVLLGRGDGSFPALGEPGRLTVPIGVRANPRSSSEAALHMVTGDFNGDGLADLAVAALSPTDNLAILLNTSQ